MIIITIFFLITLLVGTSINLGQEEKTFNIIATHLIVMVAIIVCIYLMVNKI